MRSLIAMVLVCVGCGEPAGLSPDLGERLSAWIPDSSAVLAYEDITGSGYTGHHVARDTATFNAIWQQAFGWMNQARPNIDFTTQMAVLVVGFGGAAARIRLDSVVTYVGGTRGFVSFCDAGSPLAVEGHPGELVQAPRNDGMYFHTRTEEWCR
jgi:hypothetical protein